MSASSKFFSQTSSKVTGRLKYWMKNHPIVSNSVLCVNLWIVGDFAAQYSEMRYLTHDGDDADNSSSTTSTASTDSSLAPRKTTGEGSAVELDNFSFWDEVDVFRTAKCAGFGAFVTGPILATWYPFLEGVCVKYNVVGRYGLWGAPVLKVLADEFIMDPPCLLMFFGYMNVCEGGTMDTFQKKIESQFLPSWLTSLAIWPFVLLGTFRFVPTYAQAPIINACCIVWDGFLSHRNTLSKHQKAIAQEIDDEDPHNFHPPSDKDEKIRIA